MGTTMAEHVNRPERPDETTEEKAIGARGDHAKRGPAKRIQQAVRSAPDGVSQQLIEAVAFRAIREDVHPADIWLEIIDEATRKSPEVVDGRD